ncbi:MAG: Co-chaperone protein HscB [Phycisphaerae bacterium]|nr:Co-chaperone protein HscB [Phycisphaerae bacterium]
MSQCVECGAVLSAPICCDNCGAIFDPPPGTDHFSLLGFPRVYALDEDRLAQDFRRLTAKVHPDRHARRSEDVRELATRLTADLNRAYAVVSDGARRADYLLELAGGPTASEERGVPGDLLAEVMEVREALEQARGVGDRRTIERLRQVNESKRRQTLDEIAALASAIETASVRQRQRLRLLLNALRYFENLTTELA